MTMDVWKSSVLVVKKAVKWLLIGCAGTMAIIGTLNHNGVCISEMRVLPEEELIPRGIAQAYRTHQGSIEAGFRGLGGENNIPVDYASLEDFIARNLDCCSFVEVARKGYRPSHLVQWTGAFRGFVRVTYCQDLDPKGFQPLISPDIMFTNCGRTWSEF